MQDLDLKKKVLSEIMEMMSEKEGDRLKSHPKVLAAKVEVEKPVEEMGAESPVAEVEGEEELSPELIQMLMDKLAEKEA